MTSLPATHPATHDPGGHPIPGSITRSSGRTSDRGTDPGHTTPLAARRSAYGATLTRLRTTDPAAADAVGAHTSGLRAEARQHREAARAAARAHQSALQAVQAAHAEEVALLRAALVDADRQRAYLQGRLDALEGRPAATVDAATPNPTSTTKEHQ